MPLSDLARLIERLSRALGQRSAVTLTAAELDVLAAAGGYEALCATQARKYAEAARDRVGQPHRKRDEAVAPGSTQSPIAFTPATLAEHWGVSTGAIYNLLRSGELDHFKLGRLFRIKAETVAEYERRQEMAPDLVGPSRTGADPRR